MAPSTHAMPVRGYRFGDFEVQLDSGELRRQGFKVRLQEQPLRILISLLERPGEVVTREQLKETLWSGDTFVDFDHGLRNAVNRLREALNDSADSPRFIETLARRGYRFIAPVQAVPESPETRSAEPSPKPAPPSRRWVAWLALGAVAAVIAGAMLERFAPAQKGTARARLVVLPFRNLSGDPQDDYFSDGLTEEMISDLGRLEPARLQVIAATSAMHYKKTNQRIDQIGRELGVDYVLEGSVRRAAERLRITAQLIQVRDQAPLWSHAYERDSRDSLKVQTEVARAVAGEIRLRLTPEAEARLSRRQQASPEAHELELRGRYLLNQRTEESLRRGLELFKEAVRIAPEDGLAHAGLADAYLLLGAGAYTVLPPREAFPLAQAAARKALELDEKLSAPHTTLAFISFTYDWDWASADRSFRRAIELGPNDARAHHWYALYLKSMARRDDALAEARRALELDPLSLIIGADLAWAMFHLRQYEQAAEQCRRVLELDPRFAVAHWNLGLVYEQQRKYEQAQAEFKAALELAGRKPVYLAALGRSYALAGRREEAQKILAELVALSKERYVPKANVALVTLALGETDAGFRLLAQAYDERSDFFVNLKVDPRLDPYRADPRLVELLKRLGLGP